MLQEGKNGPPVSFGHAPFTSLFYDAQFDKDLGGSSQGIAMIMARYRVDPKLELSGGLRGNRWSGAYAKFLQSKTVNPAGFDIWNNPFNVDWSQDLGGGVYKGYAARSVDMVLGARYKITDKLAAYTGMVYLGTAATDNPSEARPVELGHVQHPRPELRLWPGPAPERRGRHGELRQTRPRPVEHAEPPGLHRHRLALGEARQLGRCRRDLHLLTCTRSRSLP